jgi:basic membrane lipoprotein Med (substrate-binding protein (PBP1-ABC) superfamily)
VHDYYIIYRTRYIITNKVITGLKKLKNIPFGYPDGYVDYAINLYTELNNKAKESVEQLKRDYPDLVPGINACLLNK